MAGRPSRSISGMAQWWPARMATPSWSRMVPRSCGCTPFSVKDSTAALARRPCRGCARRECASARRWPQSSSSCSCAAACVDAQRFEEIHGRGQADGAADVGRAGLELVAAGRSRCCARSSPCGSCRRRPARAAWPPAALRRAIQHADAGGAVELVAGEAVEVRSPAPARPPRSAPRPARRRPAPARRRDARRRSRAAPAAWCPARWIHG